jgi:hypothetical protein
MGSVGLHGAPEETANSGQNQSLRKKFAIRSSPFVSYVRQPGAAKSLHDAAGVNEHSAAIHLQIEGGADD